MGIAVMGEKNANKGAEIIVDCLCLSLVNMPP